MRKSRFPARPFPEGRLNLHHENKFRRLLAHRFNDSMSLLDGVGAVSVIGAGIDMNYRNTRAGSVALRGMGVLGISTSSFRVTWTLVSEAIDDAVRQLHKQFLETD